MRNLLTLGTFLVVLFLSGCTEEESSKTMTQAGPIQFCPGDNQLSYYRKSNTPLNTYQACFDGDVKSLLQTNQLLSYVRWLELTDNFAEASQVLLQAIDLNDGTNDFYYELAKLHFKQHQWEVAQNYINASEVQDDDPLKIAIMARTGLFPIGFDHSLLPHIFQPEQLKYGQSELRAKVIANDDIEFSLTRIDDAEPEILAGETSIMASGDGKNVWVVWTDSSGSPSFDINSWNLRAARSTDGGDNWMNESFSLYPEKLGAFNFDPMTAYDSSNNTMYAGGLTTSFTDSDLQSIYLYSWDLNTGDTAGPFQQFGFVDKAWMTTDDNGGLVMIDSGKNFYRFSDDMGATFTMKSLGTNAFFSPQPKFDSEGCLHIIDDRSFMRCESSGSELLTQVNAPTTSLVFGSMENYLPGSFRGLPLRLVDFHPNGDTFIVFTELESAESDDIAIWMSRSSDGDNWSFTKIITPDIPGDRFLPWLQIDQSGRIHISYADTRNNIQPDNATDAYIDMYYSYSDDLGQSWHETRVTPTPLKIPSLESWGSYFFSDYLEMVVPNPDTVMLAFPWLTDSEDTDDMDMYFAKINSTDTDFEINQGVAGAWFSPPTSGSGLMLDVRPEDEFMFVAWFTHDVNDENRAGSDTGARWFTAAGNYQDNKAELELYETTGGLFDDPQTVTTVAVGTLEIDFSDCGSGQVSYEFTNNPVLQGFFDIQRAVPGTENLCESLAAEGKITSLKNKVTPSTRKSEFEYNQGLSSAWFYPTTSGSGLMTDIRLSDQFVFVAWFTHDLDDSNRPSEDTGARWYTAAGNFEGDSTELELYATTGGLFDDPQAVSTFQVGTATLKFDDCSRGVFSYEFTNGSTLQGEFPIQRAVPGTESLCESMTAASNQ